MLNEVKIILEPAEEGGYTATIPELPGSVSEGETIEEAREMVLDAARELIAHRDDRRGTILLFGGLAGSFVRAKTAFQYHLAKLEPHVSFAHVERRALHLNRHPLPFTGRRVGANTAL